MLYDLDAVRSNRRLYLIAKNTKGIMKGDECIMNAKELIGKYGLPVLGLVLTVAGTVVNGKNQDTKIDEAVAKHLPKALENQNKGS